MTTTIQAIRRTAALGVFAALMLAIGSPQDAAAHTTLTGDERRDPWRIHGTEAPSNLRVRSVAGSAHNAIIVSWNNGHAHEERLEHVRRLYAHDPHQFHISLTPQTMPAFYRRLCSQSVNVTPHEATEDWRCIRRWVCCTRADAEGTVSYSETFTGLTPGTDYLVSVSAEYLNRRGPWQRKFTRATFTTSSAPGTPDPETPTTPAPETPTTPTTPDPVTPAPETPTTPDPETPEPEGPTCTYEHRLVGVYGARPANTHRAEVLVSSEAAGARFEIRAYQGTTGTELDVLDRNGSAVGPDVTLGAAYSLRGFRPEGAAGRHTVIVKHPSKAAMDNATVALQLRGPEVGFQVVPVPGIEHCTTASTTTE